MKICILKDSSWVDFNPEYFFPNKEKHKFKELKVSFNNFRELKKTFNSYDLFLNFCNSPITNKKPGLDLVFELEKLNVAFTGCDSISLSHSRNTIFKICKILNIECPIFLNLNKEACIDEYKNKIDDLNYPIIVKKENNQNSKNITQNSKVFDFESLKEECQKLFKITNKIRLEEFIKGREFSCLILQNPSNSKCPITYEPIEIKLKNNSFKYENNEYDHIKITEEGLSKIIKIASKEIFTKLNGKGYARFDFILNENNGNNKLFLIDVNFQDNVMFLENKPSISDLILSNNNKHKEFMEHLIKCAFLNKK